ncbi:MAG: S8 family serine peptidase, partial [Bacteroidetes bacterium]|nr:S8 family serine peptidase [Bacteroidota bacterium]
MKKVIILAFFFAFSLNIQAQLAPLKYLVKFTDKNNSPFSVSNPSQFLSAKAIARRINQGISIKYNDLPVSPAYVDSVINTGVTILNRSKWLNSITIFTDDYLALAKIKSFPFVVSVDSVNKIYSYEHKTTFPEKLESYSSDLSNKTTNSNNDNSKNTNTYDYGFANNQISMISGDYLHNNGYCGQGVTIAVLDAGFSYVETLHIFDSLWANNQILGTKDFVESGGNVFNSHTHGMMVLSTMGGNIPGQLVGTAPKANYWLLRSEDASSEYIIEEYNWASAAEFADSAGADIINSSLGYSVFWDAVMDHTYADMNGHTAPASIAATIAASKGIIVCNSAGNSGGSYRPFIASPADADSIITIGAVDEDENYASFSSTGPTS